MKSRFIHITLFLSLSLFLLTAPASAASPKKSAPSSSPQVNLDQLPADKIDAAVAKMDDTKVREAYLSELHKKAAAEAAAKNAQQDFSAKVRAGSVVVGTNLRSMVRAAPLFGRELVRSLDDAAGHQGAFGFLKLLGSLLFLIACGYLVEWFFRHKTGPAIRDLEQAPPEHGLKKTARTAMRAVLKCINLAAFCAGSVLPLIILWKSETPARLFLAVYLEFYVLVRLTSILSRLFLAPNSPGMRLIDLSDEPARKCHAWIMRIATISLFTRSMVSGLTYAHADPGVIFLLASIKEIIVGLVMIAAIWSFRKPVAEALRDGAEDPDNIGLIRSLLAGMWHLLAIFYILLISAFWETRLLLTGIPSHAGAYLSSLFIFPLYIWVDKGVQMLLNRTFGAPETEKPVEDEDEEGKQPAEAEDIPDETAAENPDQPEEGEQEESDGPTTPSGEAEIIPIAAVRRNLPILRRFIRILIGIILALLLLRFWDIDLPVSDAVTDAAMQIFFTLLGAHLIWEFITGFIARKLSETREGIDESGALARSRTLLPLIRKTLGGFISVITFLLVLSAVGIDIGPVLAGAGIFGLAIGLGSQTLVKDIVAGVFFLMDDAFRVGDYVIMDKNEGAVEKISLRTVSLRHYLGSLMIIPFGGIKTVTNYTRGPMTIKYRIPLPLGTDPKMVKKLVKEVSKTIAADEEMGPNLLEPVKSQGCKLVQDSVMHFGIKFTAKPGTQFRIKRESLHRIQKALEEKGVLFASRSVKIDAAGLLPESEAKPEPKPEPEPETTPDAKQDDPPGEKQEKTEPQPPTQGSPAGAASSVPHLSPEQLAVIEAAAASIVLDEDDPKGKKKKKK